jgi:hypothetical protein
VLFVYSFLRVPGSDRCSFECAWYLSQDDQPEQRVKKIKKTVNNMESTPKSKSSGGLKRWQPTLLMITDRIFERLRRSTSIQNLYVENVSERRKSAKTRERKSTGRIWRKCANTPRAIYLVLSELSYYLDLINSYALIVVFDTHITLVINTDKSTSQCCGSVNISFAAGSTDSYFWITDMDPGGQLLRPNPDIFVANEKRYVVI